MNVRPKKLLIHFASGISGLGFTLMILFRKLWNIIGSKELFQQVHDATGLYNAKSHLAEMIALLGPPHQELLARSKAMSEHNWPQSVTNDIGEPCNNAQEFFDGPFFNAEGGLTTSPDPSTQDTD